MKKNWLRAAVAFTAAGALGIGMAGTASADDEEPTPVRGDITTSAGWIINHDGGSTQAALISITPEGSENAVTAYCIDITTSLQPKFIYEEGAWDGSNVANLPQVQWVLHNSYPSVDPATLLETAGVEAEFNEDQAMRVAYTATQASVWSFTDGTNLNLDDPVSGTASVSAPDEADAAVAAVYEYLTSNATEMPEPITEITFDGPTSGDLSEKIGPFSVTTPGGDAALTVENGKLVDADDNEIDAVPNGGEFYIRPDDGVAEITVKASATVTVPTGTVFMSTGEIRETSTFADPGDESQKLILAGVVEGETEAELQIEVTGEPKLPVTGLSLTNSLLLGAALLIAGAAALIIIRRRRTAATWGDAA